MIKKIRASTEADDSDDSDDGQTMVIDPSGMNPYIDKNILVRKNDIFIYKEITENLTKELVDQLESMALNLIQVCISTGLDNPKINLHLCSPGGSLDYGLAIIETMKEIQNGIKVAGVRIPVPVDTYIEGSADSCASLIACCGRRRYVSKYAGSVIHGLSSGFSGKNPDIQTTAKNLMDLERIYKDIYLSHSKLTEEEISSMIKEEKRYSAEFIVEKGLADEITETI